MKHVLPQLVITATRQTLLQVACRPVDNKLSETAAWLVFRLSLTSSGQLQYRFTDVLEMPLMKMFATVDDRHTDDYKQNIIDSLLCSKQCCLKSYEGKALIYIASRIATHTGCQPGPDGNHSFTALRAAMRHPGFVNFLADVAEEIDMNTIDLENDNASNKRSSANVCSHEVMAAASDLRQARALKVRMDGMCDKHVGTTSNKPDAPTQQQAVLRKWAGVHVYHWSRAAEELDKAWLLLLFYISGSSAIKTHVCTYRRALLVLRAMYILQCVSYITGHTYLAERFKFGLPPLPPNNENTCQFMDVYSV
jgi:hypothetical protein